MRAASEKELSELSDEDKWELEQMKKPETERQELNRLRRVKAANQRPDKLSDTPLDENTSDDDKFRMGLTRFTGKRVAVTWELTGVDGAKGAAKLFSALLMGVENCSMLRFSVEKDDGCELHALIREGEDAAGLFDSIAGVIGAIDIPVLNLTWVVEATS